MTPTLWLGVATVVTLICGVWLTRHLQRRSVPRILAFVVLVLFFRFVLSAFHPLTFPALIGPFSINALYSILVTGLGLLLIDKRLFLLKFLLPVYGLIAVILLSALLNGTLVLSIETLLKWLFFIVIALALFEARMRVERGLILDSLLRAFSVPLVLQVLAIVLGYSKRSESDGSISYVGGYHHEAVFSVILVTALVLAAMSQLDRSGAGRGGRGSGMLPLLIAVLVMFTNYRTSIIAMLLPLTGYIYFRFIRQGVPLMKVCASVVLACATIGIGFMDFSHIIERFSEIGMVMDSLADLVKAPAYYTEWEQDYFSARLYIWSQYLDGFVNGGTLQYLIGHGADSWTGLFAKYAHNTFVSYLYELGILGALALAYLFLRNMGRCWSSPLTIYGLFLFLAFGAFLIMNLGTMPLWQIEGVALFAMLNAFAWTLHWEPVFQAPVAADEESAGQDVNRTAGRGTWARGGEGPVMQ